MANEFGSNKYSKKILEESKEKHESRKDKMRDVKAKTKALESRKDNLRHSGRMTIVDKGGEYKKINYKIDRNK